MPGRRRPEPMLLGGRGAVDCGLCTETATARAGIAETVSGLRLSAENIKRLMP